MTEDKRATFDIAIGDTTQVGLTALEAWRWFANAETTRRPYVVRDSDGDVVAAGCGHVAEGSESAEAFVRFKAQIQEDHAEEKTVEGRQRVAKIRRRDGGVG